MITKNSTSRTLIIHSVPRFDALHVEHHREQLRALMQEGYRHLIFDLEKTEYINSSGLGMLVEFFNTVKRNGGSYRLLNIRPEIRWMLSQTHLDRLLLAGAGDDAPAEPVEEAPRFDALHDAMAGEILLLSHINELTERVLSLDEPIQIGRTVLDGLMAALRSQRGALFFLTHQQERLDLTHWVDTTEQPLQPSTRQYPLKFDKLEHEILSRSDVTLRQLADEDSDPSHYLLHSLGFRNLLAAPIAGRLRAYGLICIEVGAELNQLQIARPLLSTLTHICGLALEKAALLDQVSLQKSELNDTIRRLRSSGHALRDSSHLVAVGTVITGLGHQLNNKLVPVLGYLQMLLNQDDLPESVDQKLRTVRSAADEIQQIVQKMVHISGLRRISRVRMDPADSVAVALALFEDQIHSRGIEVQVSGIDNPLGSIDGDPDLLLQALVAILHRSVASISPDQPERRLRISARNLGDAIEIHVEDTGAPLQDYDAEEFPDPLLPFEQIQEGLIFNYVIPRSIVRRHKGTLDLNPAPTGGKSIRLRLPLAAATA